MVDQRKIQAKPALLGSCSSSLRELRQGFVELALMGEYHPFAIDCVDIPCVDRKGLVELCQSKVKSLLPQIINTNIIRFGCVTDSCEKIE